MPSKKKTSKKTAAKTSPTKKSAASGPKRCSRCGCVQAKGATFCHHCRLPQ